MTLGKTLAFAAVFGFFSAPFTTVLAHADGSSGFGQVFNMFFGAERAKEKIKNCEQDNQDNPGILGGINSFFCHMEKDMGITGPASVTKVFSETDPSGVVHSMSVHAEVVAGGTDGGVSYGYTALVWVCTTGCTSAANFAPAVSIVFSYNPDGSVNKGHMITDNGAFEGNPGVSASSIAYDVGTSSASQTITAKFVGPDQRSGQTEKGRFDGSKTGSLLKVTGMMVQGASASTSNSFRFAASLDVAANTGSAFFDAPGASGTGTAAISTADLTAKGDTGTPFCFSRTRSADDWIYAPAGGTCTGVAFPAAESVTDVGNYTVGGLSTWLGSMPTHPAAI